MSTKIQINSLAALERLIGGEADTEIEIRSSIVKEFTKKYLKEIAETKAMQDAIKGFGKTIEQQIGTWVKGNYSWEAKFHLSPEIEILLLEKAQRLVDAKINEVINKAIGTTNLIDRLNRLVEERSNYIVEQWTAKNIEARISAAADAKIKKKLDL